VEEMFGRSSLSFRVDQVTLVQRRDITERQKMIADTNMNNEIDCFYNMLKQLSDNWTDSEISDILSRMSSLTAGLKQKIGMLSQNAVHLGCLRQESSSSGRVAVMAEFVELVRARTAAAHTRVLDTRQKLADNNIDMERVLAALDSKTSLSRSVSTTVSPTTTSGLASQERSKSVSGRVSDSPLFGLTIPERRLSGTKGGVLGAAAERRKSKKCSVFDTIAETSHLDTADTEEPRLSSMQRFRKKSSKKVSIAENLNCDYSDISSPHHDNVTAEDDNLEDNTKIENNDNHLFSTATEIMSDVLIFALLAVLKIFNVISANPFLFVVIFILLLILRAAIKLF